MGWLSDFIWGVPEETCQHKWKILEKGTIKDNKDNVRGCFHTLQCEHCGDVMTREYCPKPLARSFDI